MTVRLWAGSYERFLFGFDVSLSDEGAVSLVQAQSRPAHRSAVKCVDASGNYLVTGGADDQIHMFNTAKDRDLGYLVNPVDGAVPCIELFRPAGKAQPSHMLSGTTDGTICIWKATGDWEHLKLMKGHKGIVNDISIHPTGKLALSVSRDSQMRLWDLTKGSCAYQAPLGGEGELVSFLPDGERYTVACGNNVTIHTTGGALVGTLGHKTKVLACELLDGGDTLITGCEGGTLCTWDLRQLSLRSENAKAHVSRIRALAAFTLPGRRHRCAASVSSDGVVKVWDGDDLLEEGAESLVDLDTKARFTCLCAAPPKSDPVRDAPAERSAKKAKKPKTAVAKE